MPKKLTPKQQRFAEEYLHDLNATQAAIRAGYAKKTAYSSGQRLLKNVEIQNAIQSGQHRRSERTGITVDEVLKRLLEINDRCLTAIPVLANGEPTGEWRFDAAGANRSAELLGRHLGMFVEKFAPTDPTGKKEYGAGLAKHGLDEETIRFIRENIYGIFHDSSTGH